MGAAMTATTLHGTERISGSERIAALDVIRGIAILFILFMNIPGMGGYEFVLQGDGRYPTWTSADWWSTFTIMTWLDGTQRGLLELLFGAGIMIMARNAMKPDAPVEIADLHYRRNIFLAIFGLFNAFVLLWWGDILLTYGLAATFLFPFRKLKPKWQLGVAAIFLATLVAFAGYNYQQNVAKLAKVERIEAQVTAGKKVSAGDKKLLDERRKDVRAAQLLPANNPDVKEDIAKANKAHHSSFAAYYGAQFQNWQFLMGWFWIIEAEIVATMLIGMALYQWGVIQGRAHARTYLILMVLGYGIGCTLRGSVWWDVLHGAVRPHLTGVPRDLSRLAVTLGHIGLINLALMAASGRQLLRPFEAAGKMPLTVYLFTSFLMMWIVFAPWGLGLWGAWGEAKMMLVAAMIITGEVVATNLGLRWYETGPMEWVWKSLAYQRRMPFRRRAPEPTLPPGLVPAD
jgi:uncharacterized protein